MLDDGPVQKYPETQCREIISQAFKIGVMFGSQEFSKIMCLFDKADRSIRHRRLMTLATKYGTYLDRYTVNVEEYYRDPEYTEWVLLMEDLGGLFDEKRSREASFTLTEYGDMICELREIFHSHQGTEPNEIRCFSGVSISQTNKGSRCREKILKW